MLIPCCIPSFLLFQGFLGCGRVGFSASGIYLLAGVLCMAWRVCFQKLQVPLLGEGNAMCWGCALLEGQRGRLGLYELGRQEQELLHQ